MGVACRASLGRGLPAKVSVVVQPETLRWKGVRVPQSGMWRTPAGRGGPPPGRIGKRREQELKLHGTGACRTRWSHPSRRGYTRSHAPDPRAPASPASWSRSSALEHCLQTAIDGGDFRDRADLARQLGFTRARISQLLDLLMLAPDLQERILDLVAVDGVEPLSERALRALVKQDRGVEGAAASVAAPRVASPPEPGGRRPPAAISRGVRG